MTDQTKIASILAQATPEQLAVLAELISAARAKASPMPPSPMTFSGGLPPDHSFGSGLPPSVLDEMCKATPDAMLRDIVSNLRQPATLATPPEARGYEVGGAVLAQRAKGE
jgi:hypothetical protein